MAILEHFNILIQIADPFAGELVTITKQTESGTKTFITTLMGFLYGFAFLFAVFRVLNHNVKGGVYIIIGSTVILALILKILELMN